MSEVHADHQAGSGPDERPGEISRSAGDVPNGIILADLGELDRPATPGCVPPSAEQGVDQLVAGGDGIEHLAQIKSLEELSLWNCPSLTNDALKHLEAMGQLRVLWISNDWLTGEGLLHVGKIERLERLTLRNSPSLKSVQPD